MIAAIHGAVIGAGVSMVSACDIRYCTQDTWFHIKVCQETYVLCLLIMMMMSVTGSFGVNSVNKTVTGANVSAKSVHEKITGYNLYLLGHS